MATDILRDTEDKMRKASDGLKKDLATIRTGQASPSLVEHIKVEYAGTPLPLNQVAGISAPEARLLVIQPWDKSALRGIEKAILASDLSLTPINDGNVIRINIPPLSEERRQELIKIVRRRVEERRVIIRNLRHEAVNALKELEKKKEISQDEQKRLLALIQKATDGFIAGVDETGRAKEAELGQV